MLKLSKLKVINTSLCLEIEYKAPHRVSEHFLFTISELLIDI